MWNPKEIEVERINEFNESANDLNIKKIILSIAESIGNGKNLKAEPIDSNIIDKYIAYCDELSPNRYLNIGININERKANIKQACEKRITEKRYIFTDILYFEFLPLEDLQILIRDLETNDNIKEEISLNKYNLEYKNLYYNDTANKGLLIKTNDNSADILNIDKRKVK